MPERSDRVALLLAEFRAPLRQLRQQADDPSFRAMALRVDQSYTSLSRVLNGPTVPTRSAVLAFVRACRGDTEWWSRQYCDLRYALRHGTPVDFRVGPEAPPDPLAIDSPAEFAKAMRRMREDSNLTLQEISDRTAFMAKQIRAHWTRIGTSTLGDMCNPEHGGIPNRRTVHWFLMAIGLPPEHIAVWEQVRRRLAER